MSNKNPKHLILAIETSCDETSLALLAVPSLLDHSQGLEIERNPEFETDSDLDLIRNTQILSSVIASQISTHALYGGVVPEIGARMHAEAIHFSWSQLLEQLDLREFGVMQNAKSKMQNLDPGLDIGTRVLLRLDKIMVTTAPGLVSALRVGQEFAKSLQFFANQARKQYNLTHDLNQQELEIFEVNHLRGHLASSFYQN